MSGSPSQPDPVAQLRHDLRTPVNQILGYSEMLQEDAEAAGQSAYVSDLQKIQLAARNLLTIVNTKLNRDALAGAIPAAAPAQTIAHRPPTATRPAPENATENIIGAKLAGLVLVVDDDENNRDMLARRLQRQGLTVTTAGGGRQALECVRHQPFDLILLDVMMP